jgi:hypothetical protein
MDMGIGTSRGYILKEDKRSPLGLPINSEGWDLDTFGVVFGELTAEEVDRALVLLELEEWGMMDYWERVLVEMSEGENGARYDEL